MQQTEGIIYTADRRKKTPHGFKTTFDFGVLYDCVLAGEEVYKSQKNASQTSLIIPFIGDIELGKEKEVLLYLEENQAFILPDERQDCYLKNPYSEDVINFFELELPEFQIHEIKNTIAIDVQENLNQLLKMTDNILIGQFSGRNDSLFPLPENAGKVFVFAINGAFEVQNRLLQPRDGLVLFNISALEFEALSDDAVLLVVVG